MGQGRCDEVSSRPQDQGQFEYYIKPELLIQEGVQDWDWLAEMYEICLSAPTAIDAAKMLDIKVPKTKKRRGNGDE